METNFFEAMFDLEHNLNEMRGCSLDISIHRPRSPSLLLSESGEEYHIRVKQESDRMDEDEPTISSSNFSLEYKTQEGQNHQVSKAANSTTNMKMQGVSTVQLALNQPPSKNIFNIHLNYDPNQALSLESWDGNFHAISLHSSMEHLALDALNVKESLIRMKK